MSDFDIRTPVTNPALVAAMEAVRRDPAPEAQEAFLSALQAARFLSPVTMDPRPAAGEGEKTTLETATRLSFPGLTDAEGKSFLPAYTDWTALKAWRDLPDEQTLVTTFDDLAGLVLRDPNLAGLVLNAHTHNLPVFRDLLERLQAGPTRAWTAPKETRVHIGQPAMEPTVLKETLSKYARTQKHIQALWLVLMEKDGELSFLLAVDFTGDRRATFDGIAAAAVPTLRKGELIDLVPANEGLGQTVARDYEPFYKRKLFGLF